MLVLVLVLVDRMRPSDKASGLAFSEHAGIRAPRFNILRAIRPLNSRRVQSSAVTDLASQTLRKVFRRNLGAMASPEQQQPDLIPFTWFQSPDKIEVNVMVKRRRPEQVTIRHETGRLECLVHSEPCPAPAAACSCAPGPATRSFELWGEVVSSSLEVDVLGSKVEIKLTKSRPGEPWPSLEKELEKEASSAAKPGPEKKEKNWDMIGDDDSDDAAGVDAMGFFQHLFAGADDDTRRAMMKSYVESNGTSLSTNWDDVKSKDFSKDV